jgi:hypothetical protein
MPKLATSRNRHYSIARYISYNERHFVVTHVTLHFAVEWSDVFIILARVATAGW